MLIMTADHDGDVDEDDVDDSLQRILFEVLVSCLVL
mgnify:CR=1 FL=1